MVQQIENKNSNWKRISILVLFVVTIVLVFKFTPLSISDFDALNILTNFEYS